MLARRATRVRVPRWLSGIGSQIRQERQLAEWVGIPNLAGVRLDTLGYTSVLAACRKGKQAAEALAVVSRVRDEAETGVTLTPMMYNLAMGACSRSGVHTPARTGTARTACTA